MAGRLSADPGIGERIRTRRVLRRWSIRFAASRAGISPSTWSRVERGLLSADNRFLISEIAGALECTVVELVGVPFPTADRDLAAAGHQIPSIRQMLVETALDEPPRHPGQPVLAELAQRVDLIRALSRKADLRGTCQLAPQLLVDLHRAAHGSEPAQALALSVLAHTKIAYALQAVNYLADAWLAAEHGVAVARQLGEPTLIALAAFCRANIAMFCGCHGRAFTLASRAVDELRPHLGQPNALPVNGMLMLRMAEAAAGLKRPDEAAELLAEADRLAAVTGETVLWDMYFGPTNLEFWRVAIEVDTGDASRAVQRGGRVNPSVIPSAARKSQFYIDLSRAFLHARKPDEAIRTLLIGERLAPQRIRASSQARETARALLERARTRPLGSPLGGICERMNLL